MEQRTADRTPDTGQQVLQSGALSAIAAAKLLEVDERTIRRAIARGDIAATKRSGVYQIAPDELEHYRTRRRAGGLATVRKSVARPVLTLLPGADRGSNAALPLALTSLIGRDTDVAVCSATLRGDARAETARLLTLTGPGGVGKTRLALAIAGELATDFPDGVWFVPLAAVRDPALVAAAIAGVLGVREIGGRSLVAGLQVFLKDRKALLLLDNFEHVLDAAPLVVDLLTVCPKLAIVTASRSELRLSGEHVFMVAPLALPDVDRLPTLVELAEIPAVRLFIERARATRADFGLNEDNKAAVTQICRRLDGLPLAIELAAVRCRVLTPDELLTRLASGAPLLTGGPRDVPDRLQSLTNAIAWSHDLLTEEERMLFRRLAIFVGGFTVEAAEWVCACEEESSRGSRPAIAGIETLLEKSLLIALQPRLGAASLPSPRFGMLETIREFGLEQLAASGEEDEVRRQHAAYFRDLAIGAEPDLHGDGDQLRWLAVFDDELPNVRAALTWMSAAGEIVGAAELTLALWRFWHIRDHFAEAEAWCSRILEQGEEMPLALRARVLAERGVFEYLHASPAESLITFHDAVQLAEASQDAVAIAWSRWERAIARMASGDLHGALADAEVSLSIYTERGERWFAAVSLWVIGWVRYFSGDTAGAESILTHILALAHELGDYFGLTELSLGFGLIEVQRGNLDLAQGHFLEAIRCGRLLDHDYEIADGVEGIAVVLGHQGHGRRAARLLGAVETQRERIGAVRNPGRDVYVLPAIAALRDLLGLEALEAAWQEGRITPFDEALAEVTRSTPIASTGDQPLTRRELEVLSLLVEGNTNSQIADELFVSHRTAASHVAAILRKLDVPTRAAAATYAVRNGLA